MDVVNFDVERFKPMEIYNVMRISQLIIKIIVHDSFEMRNFLPNLNKRDNRYFLNIKENEILFNNHEIILNLLKEVSKKYFSG